MTKDTKTRRITGERSARPASHRLGPSLPRTLGQSAEEHPQTTATSSKGLSQMARVRAAREMIHARGSEVLALQGFMALFHREVPQGRVFAMIQDLKSQGKR